MMELLTEAPPTHTFFFMALPSTHYSLLKANSMLNFNNIANAHLYAALMIHLKLYRRHPQKGQIQEISSATGAKLKQCLSQQQHFH